MSQHTTTSLFDFSDPGLAIADGYTAAMAPMPEILAQVHRRVPVDSVMARRKAFRDRLPPMVFSKLNIHGLTKPQAKYVQQSLQRNDSLFTSTQLKPKYFRLVGDKNISLLYPKATYRPEKNTFDLDLYIKSEKDLEVRFGGIFSSRPINTGMVALRYNLWEPQFSTCGGDLLLRKVLFRWAVEIAGPTYPPRLHCMWNRCSTSIAGISSAVSAPFSMM